jgi:dolichol-phosphate mannosyltransferase
VGKSRWTLSKKVKLLVDSILSFSFFPVRLISILGLLLGVGALLYGFTILVLKLLGSYNPSGWTAMMLVVLFVSSFQMIALGVLGEYVWRSLDAARQRPLYIVDATLPAAPAPPRAAQA